MSRSESPTAGRRADAAPADVFDPHPRAALEYWFFKVNAGRIALIVDWIERRKSGKHILRASVHSPHKREVIFEELSSWMPPDNVLTTEKSVGHAGDVSWDLRITRRSGWIRPDIPPAGLLRMPDLASLSAPLVTFSGWIRHGPEHTTLEDVPGSITQYWGRALAAEWWWVSAHQFDRPDVALEGIALRSHVWGMSMQVPLAYFSFHHDGTEEYILAQGDRARATGTPEHFRIDVTRKGKPSLALVCTGREYGDFGDGIINTLTGDMEIREGDRVIARALGTAGLERRAPHRGA